MNVNINYYGHSVDVDEEALADEFDFDDEVSDDEIKVKLNEYIEDAIRDDPGTYMHDGEDVVERVQEILAERRQEAEDDE